MKSYFLLKHHDFLIFQNALSIDKFLHWLIVFFVSIACWMAPFTIVFADTLTTLENEKEKSPTPLHKNGESPLWKREGRENLFFPSSLPLEYTTENSHFYCLDKMVPDKNVVILVHGWSMTKTFDTSLEETRAYYEDDWQNFIEHFQDETVCLHTWDVREGLPYLVENPLTERLVFLHSSYKMPYQKINIIAHSQGGNYAKDALNKLYQQTQNERIREIDLVTIATPHTGSEKLYLRNVAKSAEILGYTALGIAYSAWLHSLYENYQNATTAEEKTQYQIMLGVFGTLGAVGAIFVGRRVSQFNDIYNYPGLLQLMPVMDNPVLTHINEEIRENHLYSSMSAIYSDYGVTNGDAVVPVPSGSWEDESLKSRQFVPGRDHLGLMAGDAEIFAFVDKLVRE
jgi:hypothetical protein